MKASGLHPMLQGVQKRPHHAYHICYHKAVRREEDVTYQSGGLAATVACSWPVAWSQLGLPRAPSSFCLLSTHTTAPQASSCFLPFPVRASVGGRKTCWSTDWKFSGAGLNVDMSEERGGLSSPIYWHLSTPVYSYSPLCLSSFVTSEQLSKVVCALLPPQQSFWALPSNCTVPDFNKVVGILLYQPLNCCCSLVCENILSIDFSGYFQWLQMSFGQEQEKKIILPQIKPQSPKLGTVILYFLNGQFNKFHWDGVKG